MNNNILASIIIPCYQSQNSIENTLNSILSQTYQNIEIIAVNDGSTDKTGQILQQYENKIRIIKQNNQGAPTARNRGFAESKGQYVLFCDDDVSLEPTMIEKMLKKLMSNPGKAYCYCNFKFGWHTFDLFPFDAEKLKKENYISTMSLIRRECFIGFDEKLKRFQDWDLWKRMLDRGYEGIWYPERLFSGPMKLTGISKFSLKNIFKLIKNRIIKQ